ncbi:MAG: hypothetical protein L0154_15805 [Chloroflexi bacterium]|nr:hypothetical protein [Chloroflexota bacterium]
MKLWQRLAAGLMAAAAFTIALLAYLGAGSDNLAVTAEVPESVIAGEAFDVTLNIENKTDSPQTIVSIGLAESLQEQGLIIEETLPDYRTVDKRSIWSEYTFAITRRPVIEPGESIPLRVTLVASRPGTVDGQLTLWLEKELQATYVAIQLQVVDE